MSCCCRCCDRAAYAAKKAENEISNKKLVCLYRAITLASASAKQAPHAQQSTAEPLIRVSIQLCGQLQSPHPNRRTRLHSFSLKKMAKPKTRPTRREPKYAAIAKPVEVPAAETAAPAAPAAMAAPAAPVRRFALPATATRGHRLVFDLADRGNAAFSLAATTVAREGLRDYAASAPSKAQSEPTPKPAPKRQVQTATAPVKNTVRAPTPAPSPTRSKWTVFIDAGHGGKDPGAIGR